MIMYNPSKPSDVASVKNFVDGMMHKALDMEGTVSVSCLDDGPAFGTRAPKLKV